MNRARLAVFSSLLVSLWGIGGCASHGRCTEFHVDALAVSAEIGMQEVGGNASLERHPALPMSEEAAIYTKRLKTLCELLWEDRISYTTYRAAAREAYDGYQLTRETADPHTKRTWSSSRTD